MKSLTVADLWAHETKPDQTGRVRKFWSGQLHGTNGSVFLNIIDDPKPNGPTLRLSVQFGQAAEFKRADNKQPIDDSDIPF